MSPWISDLYLRSQTDARLLSLTRDGHGRAFAVLAERYRAELLAQARRLGSSANAEDLLQQTMLSAFAALDRGVEVGHVRGWLHAILRNAAIRARGPVEAPLELALQTGEAPDALLEARADARLVLSALDQLPARQREALVGSSVQGRSRAELATTLGVSQGAVRQLVHRARSTVRAAVTSLTPYPLIRWLTSTGGSASAGPPGLGLGSGAAGAGGVVAKLGMVAAAGVIAASGLTAAGHHETRGGARAGRRVQGPHPGTAVAAAAAVPGGLPSAASGGEVMTVPVGLKRGAGASTWPGDSSGRGPTGTPIRGRQPGSTRGHDGPRGPEATGRSSATSESGSAPGPAPGTSDSSSNGSRVRGGPGDGGSGSGAGGSGSGDGGSSSSDGGSGPGAGGSNSNTGAAAGRSHGDTTTTAASSVSTPAASTATDGGGGSGRGDSNGQVAGTSMTSSGSRDLLPPADSSPTTDQ